MTTSAQPPGPPSSAMSPSSAPLSQAQEPSSPNSSPTSSQPPATATAAKPPDPPAPAAACSPAQTVKSKPPLSVVTRRIETTTSMMLHPRICRRGAILKSLSTRGMGCLGSRLQLLSGRSRTPGLPVMRMGVLMSLYRRGASKSDGDAGPL